MKEQFISLIVLQAKRKLVTSKTHQVVKQIICSCGILGVVEVMTPLAKNTARWSVARVRSKIFMYCALHYIFQAINAD